MTDMQSRLEVIENWASKVKAKHTTDHVPGEPDIAVLCYLVSYLAKIVRKHLETGEV